MALETEVILRVPAKGSWQSPWFDARSPLDIMLQVNLRLLHSISLLDRPKIDRPVILSHIDSAIRLLKQ